MSVSRSQSLIRRVSLRVGRKQEKYHIDSQLRTLYYRTMLATCLYCKDQFEQVAKGKKKKYCTKQCSYNASYYRHIEYYRKRYQETKEHYLSVCREYRDRPEIKEKRKEYYETYKPSEQNKRRERYRNEEWFRSRNQSRGRARAILLKFSPERKCCHCGSCTRVICHHVDENPLNNSTLNLCWICSKCHGIIHSIVPDSRREEIQKSINRFLAAALPDQKPHNTQGYQR